jgi:dTDP-4-amino-4,6-dideoxygalactose transaminase
MLRPEPATIKSRGYEWDDPRDIVDLFEKKLAAYSGARLAVLTGSCSSALFLSMKLRGVRGTIEIPVQTYASRPMHIHHAGGKPLFRNVH